MVAVGLDHERSLWSFMNPWHDFNQDRIQPESFVVIIECFAPLLGDPRPADGGGLLFLDLLQPKLYNFRQIHRRHTF
jgi:hypothetical protein